MHPRISYYVQKVAFTLALIIPATLLIESQPITFYLAAYAWGVGILAAIWNRLTVAE